MTFCDETDGYCAGPTVTVYTRRRVFHVCADHAAPLRRFARIEAHAGASGAGALRRKNAARRG